MGFVKEPSRLDRFLEVLSHFVTLSRKLGSPETDETKEVHGRAFILDSREVDRETE